MVYARLIIDGKDLGVHEFMVQLRDEKHDPMPGVEVGDVGPKVPSHLHVHDDLLICTNTVLMPVVVTGSLAQIGYNNVDNGYARFDHVRVPRFNMLAKHQEVTA